MTAAIIVGLAVFAVAWPVSYVIARALRPPYTSHSYYCRCGRMANGINVRTGDPCCAEHSS